MSAVFGGDSPKMSKKRLVMLSAGRRGDRSRNICGCRARRKVRADDKKWLTSSQLKNSSSSIGTAFHVSRMTDMAGLESCPSITAGRFFEPYRMGVAREFQGQKHGRRLLFAALYEAWKATRHVMSFAVVVDAKSEHVVPFYEKFGFRRLEGVRLIMPMKTIEKVVCAAQ